jgi:hypothetical protein
LQHFQFDGTKQGKIVIKAILKCPLVAMVTGKFKHELASTKAMVQLTFVPRLISIKAFFTVS